MSPLIQDGIITTLNTRVFILAAASPLYRDLTVRGSQSTTENIGEIPKLLLSIL